MDAEKILQMGTSFWISQALFTAIKIGLFDALKEKPLDADELSRSLGIHPRPCQMMANGCCSLGLLEKEGKEYKNSALAETFLIKGKPNYLGDFVGHAQDLYQSWASLEEAVRNNGLPGKGLMEIFSEDPGLVERFIKATYAMSSISAPLLAKSVDLSDCKRLLDVGGGSGINSIELVKANPGLEATILDHPKVCEIAEGIIQQHSLSSKIKTLPGDYKKGIPQGFDYALLSHILHGEGKEECRWLLKEVFHSMSSPGKILIVDFLLNDKKDSPMWPALFALNMLIHTKEGDVYTEEEIYGLLREAGFMDLEKKPLLEGISTWLIIGRKS